MGPPVFCEKSNHLQVKWDFRSNYIQNLYAECPMDDVGTIVQFYRHKEAADEEIHHVKVYYEQMMLRKFFFYPMFVFCIILLIAAFILVITQCLLGLRYCWRKGIV